MNPKGKKYICIQNERIYEDLPWGSLIELTDAAIPCFPSSKTKIREGIFLGFKNGEKAIIYVVQKGCTTSQTWHNSYWKKKELKDE